LCRALPNQNFKISERRKTAEELKREEGHILFEEESA